MLPNGKTIKMVTTSTRSSQKKYRASTAVTGRAWYQTAQWYFWVGLLLVAALVLGGAILVGRAVFRPYYAPIEALGYSGPDAPKFGARQADTATPAPNVTATPAGMPEWSRMMVLIDNSAVTQISDEDKKIYSYDFTSDTDRQRLSDDWTEAVNNLFVLPSVFYARHPDLIQRYTAAGRLKPTPTGAPTATAIPAGATIEGSTPGTRQTSLLGCNADGTACYIFDIWTNITVYKYDLQTEKVVGQRPGKSALGMLALLRWKDQRWRLSAISGKVIQYVTATPVSTKARQ